MKRWSPQQLLLTVLLSGGFWAVVATLCIMGGSGEFGWPEPSILRLRREATIVASLVGAALAAAGVAYQAVLRNPLAEPYLLGVSSGSALAVSLWALPIGALPILRSLSQQSAAFAGAAAALLVVFSLAQRRGRLDPVTLLLVGVIVNAINGAIFLLLFHRGAAQDLMRAIRFLAGGLQTNLEPLEIGLAAAASILGWLALFFLSGRLNIAGLGESEAQSLGVRVHRLRWITLIVASLITASAVSISGPIGFVGLVCPHVGRLLVGNDQRRLLPVATALGASLLAVADVGSRQLGQLPVGVLTGFLGGPFFLFLLWRGRREGGNL